VGGFGGLNELLTDRQSDEARMKQKMTQYHTVQKRMAKSAKQRREHESTYKEELAMEKLRKEKEEITRRKREGEERLKKMREERLKREALRKKKEEAELLKQSKRTYARQRDMHKMNEERWSEFEEHLPDVIEYKVPSSPPSRSPGMHPTTTRPRLPIQPLTLACTFPVFFLPMFPPFLHHCLTSILFV